MGKLCFGRLFTKEEQSETDRHPSSIIIKVGVEKKRAGRRRREPKQKKKKLNKRGRKKR